MTIGTQLSKTDHGARRGRVAVTDRIILTERGEALFPILIAMQQWGDCWVYGNDSVPVELVDKRTGETLAPLTVSNASGEVVSHLDIGTREACEPANERAANEGRR